jgi:hypothetical protein
MSKEKSFLLRSRKYINHRQDSPRKMDIIGGILPVDTMEASGRKIGRHYQPQQRKSVVLATIAIFHTRCSGARGRPRSQLLRVGHGSNLTTGHYGSKRAEDWTTLPATIEKLCCFGYNRDLSRSLLGCRGSRAPKITVTGGSGDGILPLVTMEAIGWMIGRHYQPQQRNFVVLATVTIAIFHARCSGARGRPRSQLLRVGQGSNLITGHYGSKRAEDLDVTPAASALISAATESPTRNPWTSFSRNSGGSLRRPRQSTRLLSILLSEFEPLFLQ